MARGNQPSASAGAGGSRHKKKKLIVIDHDATIAKRRNKALNATFLRGYQQDIVDEVLRLLATSKNDSSSARICVKSPTASGKTIMAIEIIVRRKKLGNHSPLGLEGGPSGQIMIIVHTRDLVNQWEKVIKEVVIGKLGLNVTVGIESGSRTADPWDDIIIATRQTLHQSPARLAKFARQCFELVISDECHGAAGPCWSSVLPYFNADIPVIHKRKRRGKKGASVASVVTTKGADGMITCHHVSETIDDDDEDDFDCQHCIAVANQAPHEYYCPQIGFSATPDKFDGSAIDTVFPHRVDRVTTRMLLDKKHVSELLYVGFTGYFGTPTENALDVAVNEGTDLLSKMAPTDDADSLSEDHLDHPAVKSEEPKVPRLLPLNEGVIRNWKIARSQGRKSTLIFCQSVHHVLVLEADFLDHGVNAACIVGSTRDEDCRSIMDDFQAGRVDVLINCVALIEGVDMPWIDCLILARPTHSEARAEQEIGRARRLYKGKKDCLILDFTVDVKHATGLAAFPRLMKDIKVLEEWQGHGEDRLNYSDLLNCQD